MAPPGPKARHTLTLYTSPDRVECHLVRLVLAIKGLPYEALTVGHPRVDADLLEYNPTGAVPTLIERDVVLYCAPVMAEYLDERFPHPSLLPSDPLGRARSRMAMQRVLIEWERPLQTVLAGGADADSARRSLRSVLLASVDLFRAAKFFLSPELGLADCAVLPVLWRLQAAGIELPASADPIRQYADRLFETAFFQRSLTEHERKLR